MVRGASCDKMTANVTSISGEEHLQLARMVELPVGSLIPYPGRNGVVADPVSSIRSLVYMNISFIGAVK
jgi:hypothetical protein